MFRGNNSNSAVPSFLDNQFQYSLDMSNQPKLCGNVPVEFHGNTVNYLGKNQDPQFLLPNRCDGDAEPIPGQQKIQFSMNNTFFRDEPDRKAGVLNMNPVSTGLRLSYDDDERNSSITSASGSLMDATSVFSALNNDIKREIDQQNKELDHFIRIQEENMVKGLRDIRQRHITSFLAVLEKGVAKKIQEKDLELDRLTRRNKELVETMNQVSSEAHNWCYMAKYNESVVNALRANLHQAATTAATTAAAESSGDSHDPAASRVGPTNEHVAAVRCRLCGANEASVLVMPCRHLCLCRECKRFATGLCPVCRASTTASFEVYLS